jgi:endonuclease-3
MVQLGEATIADYVRSLNYYRTKARHVWQLSAMLCTHHAGVVPDTREALMALPGVGRKTANVVLQVAFGHPTIGVDTHVHRVSNRLGLVHSHAVAETEAQLLTHVPAAWHDAVHHLLVLHGRYVCTAKRPRCLACAARTYCPASVSLQA